ncbi:ATP-binding protein [Streptosporangium soli]|nr:ATP-binding protein [Streptosporangium sp. KLBMP 9127]
MTTKRQTVKHGTMPRTASMDLLGISESVPRARDFARRIIGSDHPCLNDALLLLSEVVTNGIKHSNSRKGGIITLRVSAGHGGVRCEVTDDGSPSWPDMEALLSMPGEIWDLSGRGIRLIDRLADQWGRYPLGAAPLGRTVWFELVERKPQ